MGYFNCILFAVYMCLYLILHYFMTVITCILSVNACMKLHVSVIMSYTFSVTVLLVTDMFLIIMFKFIYN